MRNSIEEFDTMIGRASNIVGKRTSKEETHPSWASGEGSIELRRNF
jgi:hypothetical protein